MANINTHLNEYKPARINMEPENNTQLDKKQNEIEHHHVFGFHVKFPGCFLNHHAFVDPKLM